MTEEVSTQIAEYSITTAELAKLRARFQGVTYDVSTTAGLDIARKDRRELVALRTALEAKRAEIKAPALAQCNLIDSEAKRIKAEIVALETPIDAVIKAEEARKEAEKAEKARIAAEAQKALDDKILAIIKLPNRCIGESAPDIEAFLSRLEAQEIGGEFTGETRTRAEAAKAEAIADIKKIHADAVELEQKAAIQKAEHERLVAEQIEAAKEAERIAAIQREEMEKQQAELDEQKRLNAIESARLAELAKAENERIAETRRQEQAAAAELKRQQDILDAEKREKEKQEALEAEQKRVAAEKERKAAEKKAKLLAARCKDAETALIKILEICRNEDLDGTDALAQIELIAEASI